MLKRHSKKIVESGAPNLWFGVNFWSRGGGPRMWAEYDPDLVRAELREMRDLGIPLTRSFLYWPDFMPTSIAVDPTAADRYDDFLAAHAALGMRTIPTFIVGHMSGQNWDPVWRRGRDLFADPWFVERQEWFVSAIVERYSQHPAIAGWLLTNEIPIYADGVTRGAGTIDAAKVRIWAGRLISAARAAGATQPISVGDGAWGLEMSGADNGFRVRDLAPLVDFHGPHVYRMERDGVRQMLSAAFACEMLDIGNRPVILEEFGVSSDQVGDEAAAHYYRQSLHNSLLAGATGWIAWNNTDYDALENREPYSHHPHEMHFGITDCTGAAKPQAKEFAAFIELAGKLDLADYRRPSVDAAVIVPAFLESRFPFTQPLDATTVIEVTRQAYVASREADLPIALVREVDGIPDGAKLYLLPSAKQLTAPSWKRLDALVEAGATVYASYFAGSHDVHRGTWWPSLDARFGVAKKIRYGLIEPIPGDLLDLTFLRDFGDIAAGTVLAFPLAGNRNARSYLPCDAAGADVLAVDGAGHPALLLQRRGKGSYVLGCFPVEYMAAAGSDINPEPTWRLYSALAEYAGAIRPVQVDDPRVGCATMEAEDGRTLAWFVNFSPDELRVRPLTPRHRCVEALRDLPVSDLRIPPYGVEVVRLESLRPAQGGTIEE